jgi:hypothetical protein
MMFGVHAPPRKLMQSFSGQVGGGGLTLLLRRGTMWSGVVVTDWIPHSKPPTSSTVYKGNHEAILTSS